MIHCLHGAVGHFRNWDLFKDLLGAELRAHDLWNHFENASPSLTQAGQTINAQANSSSNSSSSEKDILLGYSMGGRIALHSLLSSAPSQPPRWRAAIIISAHPGLEKGRAERRAHDEKWSKLALSDWPLFQEKWNAQSILPTTTHGLELAPASARHAIAKSFHHWSLGQQENLRPQLKKITLPLLWITGQHDEKFSTLAQECLPLLPNAQHLILPHCGHRLPWENPSGFSKIVKNFLADHD